MPVAIYLADWCRYLICLKQRFRVKIMQSAHRAQSSRILTEILEAVVDSRSIRREGVICGAIVIAWWICCTFAIALAIRSAKCQQLPSRKATEQHLTPLSVILVNRCQWPGVGHCLDEQATCQWQPSYAVRVHNGLGRTDGVGWGWETGVAEPRE